MMSLALRHNLFRAAKSASFIAASADKEVE